MIVHDPNNTARIKTHDTKSVNEPRLILKYRLEPYSSYYQIFEHTSHMKLYRFSTEILVFFFFLQKSLNYRSKIADEKYQVCSVLCTSGGVLQTIETF